MRSPGHRFVPFHSTGRGSATPKDNLCDEPGRAARTSHPMSGQASGRPAIRTVAHRLVVAPAPPAPACFARESPGYARFVPRRGPAATGNGTGAAFDSGTGGRTACRLGSPLGGEPRGGRPRTWQSLQDPFAETARRPEAGTGCARHPVRSGTRRGPRCRAFGHTAPSQRRLLTTNRRRACHRGNLRIRTGGSESRRGASAREGMVEPPPFLTVVLTLFPLSLGNSGMSSPAPDPAGREPPFTAEHPLSTPGSWRARSREACCTM